MKVFFFFLICLSLFAYRDAELDGLWLQIPDLYHPRLEDFRRIERYLKEGRRPYLDFLKNEERDPSKEIRLQRIRDFQMVGPKGESPLFEVLHLNQAEETQDRCILIFGSHNGKEKSYAVYAREIVQELERIGYSGDVLLRIGGFPGIDQGALKYSYVPYAFKVAFFEEARALGYREILWVDCALHPIRDLEWIFQEMQESGYFFLTAGPLMTHASHFPLEVAEKIGLPPFLYSEIPHIVAAVIGLNRDHPLVDPFLDQWVQKTRDVLPNIAFFPEEMGLSLVAWEMGFFPRFGFGDILCIGHEIQRLNVFRDRPHLQFYVGGL